jgi:hypothetical protein
MRYTSKITIILLTIVGGSLSVIVVNLKRKNDSVNEFASFAAVSIYHINKDLDLNKYEIAKKSASETYYIIKETQKFKKFHGRYWRDFDHYAFGTTW